MIADVSVVRPRWYPDGPETRHRGVVFDLRSTERIVQHFGLAHYFGKVYGPELDGRRDDKVELVAYLLASEGVDAETAVMVGDRAADVRSAKANRVGSIGVLWGYGSEQELLDAGADVLCKTPSELAAHLFSETQSSL